jgi:hypothetical protein
MTTTVAAPLAAETLADLHERLGRVPLSRIRCHPAPGMATEADVLIRPNGEKHFFELVEGVLVEKPMGYYEELPAGPVPDMVPDLAVEVISEGNTEEEMERKLKEYFTAGARLVWTIYPDEQSVHVHTSPTDARVLLKDETLDGGTVLPGFELTIRELFDRAGHRQGRS